ncbi:hypothetical protein ACFL03_07875 [Thermodesulfobacteriota bacterium]
MVMIKNEHAGTKWKDRGWWISVEFSKLRSRRKNFSTALELLKGGIERYDMILENGKTIARGIFSNEADMSDLAELLEMTAGWKGTAVHANGRRLDAHTTNQLRKQLKCVSENAPCRTKNNERRLDFLGCHLMQIGLLNYSLKSLKDGNQYWFSFFRQGNGSKQRFFLDKNALTKAACMAELCPLYPQNTEAKADKLPLVVDLYEEKGFTIWVSTKDKIHSRWLSRYPPVVPRSEKGYNQWIKKRLNV